jgi:AraC family transcriptional regulator
VQSNRGSLRFVRAGTGERDDEPMRESTVLASSGPLGWDGIACEIGASPRWESNDVTLAGHFVTLNIGSEPLAIERKTPHGFVNVTMPPGTVWINPAGASFTQRNGPAEWTAFDVSVEKVRRVLGCDIDLPPFGVLSDGPLTAVMSALAAEVRSSGASGMLFADALAIAFVSRLARLAGLEDAVVATGSALAGRRMAQVKEWVESSLAETIVVADLAAVAELSPAHFAREFKRLTRESPHAYVMRRRLARARELLVLGSSISEAAHRCGFADQAHLSRLFARCFGLSPGVFVRRSRVERAEENERQSGGEGSS